MTDRDAQHPIPAGNTDGDHLGDGAYVSHDGYQIWVSCDRERGLEAVALDRHAIEALVGYAKRIGFIK